MKIVSTNYSYTVEHSLGLSYYSENYNIGYIPIPKCGSTFFKNYFNTSLNFKQIHLSENNFNKKFIVIIRHPFQRWISGISKFVELYNSRNPVRINLEDEALVDLLCHQLIFDPHTSPQTMFLNNIDTDDCIFLKIDSPTFTNDINNFLSTLDVNIKFPNYNDEKHKNTSDYSHVKAIFTEKFKTFRYMSHFRQVFAKDYDLYKFVAS